VGLTVSDSLVDLVVGDPDSIAGFGLGEGAEGDNGQGGEDEAGEVHVNG